jgi:hypothetical protein
MHADVLLSNGGILIWCGERIILPSVRPLAFQTGKRSESLGAGLGGWVSTFASCNKKTVVISRGPKDGFACTAGLAGTDVCGGKCKRSHQWNGAGQSHGQQKDTTREGGSPLASRHGEDVNSVVGMMGKSPCSFDEINTTRRSRKINRQNRKQAVSDPTGETRGHASGGRMSQC